MKTNDSQYKIGVSKDPKKRAKELQTGNSEIIEVVAEFPTEKAYLIETILHNRYSYLNEHGEWYNLSLKEEVEFIETCRKMEENILFLIKQNNAFIK